MKAFKNLRSWFMAFFLNYLWVGLVLVCVAIILDLQYPGQPDRLILFSAFILLLETVGIAIIVASIFSFAFGTSRFMSRIRELLQDIVLSRTFLANIDTNSKKEVMKAIIKPSSEEQKIYSNIEDYYNNCIEQTLSISQKCVRSSYNILCVAKFDPEKKRVITRETASYRLFPTTEGYNDIKLGFFDYDETFTPICERLKISAPSGKHQVWEPLEMKVEEIKGQNCLMGTANLQEIGSGMSHLDIELTLSLTEHDHWACIAFQALQPTDGFRYHLICEDGIQIRSENIFTFDVDVQINRIGNTELIVSTTQWLNEGAGLSIVVSKDIKDTEG